MNRFCENTDLKLHFGPLKMTEIRNNFLNHAIKTPTPEMNVDSDRERFHYWLILL